jgi:hypothetical protein
MIITVKNKEQFTKRISILLDCVKDRQQQNLQDTCDAYNALIGKPRKWEITKFLFGIEEDYMVAPDKQLDLTNIIEFMVKNCDRWECHQVTYFGYFEHIKLCERLYSILIDPDVFDVSLSDDEWILIPTLEQFLKKD